MEGAEIEVNIAAISPGFEKLGAVVVIIGRLSSFAIKYERVVLPSPGGPEKRM